MPPVPRRWLVPPLALTAAAVLGACGGADTQGATEVVASTSAEAPTSGAAGAGGPADPAQGSTVQTAPPSAVATDEPVTVTNGEATVNLSFADWDDATGSVQAGGFVSGLVEAGGRCTLTLIQGTDEVTAETDGTPDASTTLCTGLEISAADLSSGTWAAVLSYASDDATGSSDSVSVVVP